MICTLDDDDKKPGIQIPLITDMVIDGSPRMKPPASRPGSRSQYAPDYDPDTKDLFDDQPDHIDQVLTDELRQNADAMIEDLVHEYSSEIEQRLRQELTAQLLGILDDLDHQEKNQKQ